MEKQEFFQDKWDKGKIIKGLAILLIFACLLFFAFKMHILDKYLKKNLSSSQGAAGQVKGAQTTEADISGSNSAPADSFLPPSSENIQSSLKDRVSQLKQEVSNLNVLEVASSSSQVQKVLQDVKSLEQYPHNQAKEACLNICNSL
ncbi:hypothetical protein M1615_01150 [Patescibacteria group bacterium]|nr:hypothetical protein [Patescibacteria group bacterium]MCL5010147.1 hypothetical protein [Patescibacteria group bacterium]